MASTLDDLPVSQLEAHIRKSGLLDGFTFGGVDYPALVRQYEYYDESYMNKVDPKLNINNKELRFVTILSGGDQSAIPSQYAERTMKIIISGLPVYDKVEAAAMRGLTEQITDWLRSNFDDTGCIYGMTVLNGAQGPFKDDSGRFSYEIDALVGFSVV